MAPIAEIQQAVEEQLVECNTQLQLQGRPRIQVDRHATWSDVLVLTPGPVIPCQPDPTWSTVLVDACCGEAILRGSHVYAPGILCASAHLLPDQQVNVFARTPLPEECPITRGMALEHYTGSMVFVGRAKTTMSRNRMFREKKGLALVIQQHIGADAPSLHHFLPHLVYAQNLPSIYVGRVLRPQPGELVLDMCSAPGGKTSHLAAMMQNEGIVVACERSKRKVLEMTALFQQMGATCILPLQRDSTQLVLTQSEQERLQDVDRRDIQVLLSRLERKKVAFFPSTFDRILLDPSCSALGLRPRLAHPTCSLKDLEGYTSLQRNLFWAAAFLLRPGGIVVYSTCTLNPMENEQMVAHVLKTHPELELRPARIDMVPHLGTTGLLNQGLSKEEADMVVRFTPSQTCDTPGFFCAKFQKRALRR